MEARLQRLGAALASSAVSPALAAEAGGCATAAAALLSSGQPAAADAACAAAAHLETLFRRSTDAATFAATAVSVGGLEQLARAAFFSPAWLAAAGDAAWRHVAGSVSACLGVAIATAALQTGELTDSAPADRLRACCRLLARGVARPHSPSLLGELVKPLVAVSDAPALRPLLPSLCAALLRGAALAARRARCTAIATVLDGKACVFLAQHAQKAAKAPGAVDEAAWRWTVAAAVAARRWAQAAPSDGDAAATCTRLAAVAFRALHSAPPPLAARLLDALCCDMGSAMAQAAAEGADAEEGDGARGECAPGEDAMAAALAAAAARVTLFADVLSRSAQLSDAALELACQRLPWVLACGMGDCTAEALSLTQPLRPRLVAAAASAGVAAAARGGAVWAAAQRALLECALHPSTLLRGAALDAWAALAAATPPQLGLGVAARALALLEVAAEGAAAEGETAPCLAQLVARLLPGDARARMYARLLAAGAAWPPAALAHVLEAAPLPPGAQAEALALRLCDTQPADALVSRRLRCLLALSTAGALAPASAAGPAAAAFALTCATSGGDPACRAHGLLLAARLLPSLSASGAAALGASLANLQARVGVSELPPSALNALPAAMVMLNQVASPAACAPSIVADTFRLRHPAHVHAAAAALLHLMRRPPPGHIPLTLVPSDAAMGIEALKAWLRAQMAPEGTRLATAWAELGLPAESAALEADVATLAGLESL